MIYKSIGIRTNKLDPLDAEDDFTFIANYRAPMQVGTKEEFKQKNAEYAIAGEIEPGPDGRIVRNNKSLKSRTLAFLDYDDLTVSKEEFKGRIGWLLGEYSHIVYPTISYTDNKPRYRLVVALERPANEVEYAQVLKELADKLDFPYDHSSGTWSQLQGLPVSTEDNQHEARIIAMGKPYPVKPVEQPIALNFVQPAKVMPVSQGLAPGVTKIADYDEEVRQYIRNDSKNLDSESNWSALRYSLLKSLQVGELTQDQAYNYAVWLAKGNHAYEANNVSQLQDAIYRNDAVNEGTMTFIERVRMVNLKASITSIAALKKILAQVGNTWRAENSTVNSKGEVKLPAPMHAAIVADKLKQYCHFRLIGTEKDTAPLYIYNFDTGVYVASDTLIQELIQCIEWRHNTAQWKNVIAQLRTKVPLVPTLQNSDLIPVNNGIYQLSTDTLLPFSPEYAITSKIATNFKPDAQCPKYFDFDAWLKTIACDDEEVIMLLWQVINESLNPNYTRGKMGFLVGGGNNGKGTFQKMLIQLIGPGNVSTLKPHNFDSSKHRFDMARLMGKVCNIGDDISSGYIDDASNLMSVVTGDSVGVEIKQGPAYDIAFKLFCLFSANEMPRMRNKSNGLYRRMLIIPFNADFNGKAENKKIKDKYMEDPKVLEYVLSKAIRLKFDSFIHPQAAQDALAEYRKENDYLEAYLESVYIESGYHELALVPMRFIRYSYGEFLEDMRSKEKVPYHFARGVANGLNTLTGNKYERRKSYFSHSDIQQLPLEIQEQTLPGMDWTIAKKGGPETPPDSS